MSESSQRQRTRAPLNRTITLTDEDRTVLGPRLHHLTDTTDLSAIINHTIHGDLFAVADYLPAGFVDLLFVDPPYNLNKTFNSNSFTPLPEQEYEKWIDQSLDSVARLLKPTASIYVCCDWRSSNAIYNSLRHRFIIRNRITWEREKGRGAKANWKNCAEDIWFATVSNDYYFNPDAVKLKRKVIAPYKDIEGKPKDWQEDGTEDGVGGYRLTYPSNLWTDITVPFWSMPENTDHPTQKPEKLLAKVILASSQAGDTILDPFLGSGTTSVVAKKLARNYVGIEIDELYALLAEKRLQQAAEDRSIQGYADGIFWERNSANSNTDPANRQLKAGKKTKSQLSLF